MSIKLQLYVVHGKYYILILCLHCMLIVLPVCFRHVERFFSSFEFHCIVDSCQPATNRFWIYKVQAGSQRFALIKCFKKCWFLEVIWIEEETIIISAGMNRTVSLKVLFATYSDLFCLFFPPLRTLLLLQGWGSSKQAPWGCLVDRSSSLHS